MATVARTTHAKAGDQDCCILFATARRGSPGLNTPPRACAKVLGQLRGASGQFPRPQTKPPGGQPMRAREQSKAAPRARGGQDTSLEEARNPHRLVASPPAQIARPQLTRAAGPFPTRKGCPRIARAHPRRQAAPGLQNKRCQALEAVEAVLPTGSRAQQPALRPTDRQHGGRPRPAEADKTTFTSGPQRS